MQSARFRHSVIYHILIDRFAGWPAGATLPNDTQPGFCGGTLQGIREKLAYIRDLGADAILLSPFNGCVAYHGYHITDFYAVDPRFGSEADLRALVAAAHEQGIRLYMDFVPNHCSREHPFFKEALVDPNSPYRGWFFFGRCPGEYLCFLDIADLPKLNLDHPEAAAHLIGAGLRWAGCGIDGFRIDHSVGPSRAFLRAFRAELGEKYPDAITFGEAWIARPPLRFLKTVSLPHKYARFWTRRITQESVQRDMIGLVDGALDFATRDLFLRRFIHRHETAENNEALLRELECHYNKYPSDFFLTVFLDNHDTNRVLFECGNDKKKLMRALALLFSLPAPVLLYYGTESGLTQERPLDPAVPFSDLEARRLMNWGSLDCELIEYVKRLIRFRRERI